MSQHKQMRVLHVIDSLGRGGKERQLAIINRHEVDSKNLIACFSRRNADYIDEYALQDRLFDVAGKSFVSRLKILIKIVKESKTEVVVSWGTWESALAQIACLLCRTKFINFSIQHGIRLPKLSHFTRSILSWISPYVLANSLAGLEANNLKLSKRHIVLYNGIETIPTMMTNREVIENRQRLFPKLTTTDLIFVSVANFVPYKDYVTVLKAMSKLTEQYGFYYVVLGDGPMRPRIERDIQDLGLTSRVKLMGAVANVSDYLQISDIMIHSSQGEGISNAILEGMFVGLPIIATRVGGVPETVYQKSSELFEYQDDKTLLEILKRAPKLFTGFDPNSEEYQKHLDHFRLEQMIMSYEEILRSVLENK